MIQRRIFLILIIISGLVGGVIAQTTPRDYGLSEPSVSYSTDYTMAKVEVTITNLGGDASQISDVKIISSGDARVLETLELTPLAAGETVKIKFELPLTDLAIGDTFFIIEAGIDQFELAGSPIASNNRGIVTITKPDTATIGDISAPQTTTDTSSPYDFVIPLVNLGITLNDTTLQINQDTYLIRDILMGIGAIIVGLILLWFLVVILRLLFRRKPTFGTWQPPYAYHKYNDPNSPMGRRQGWQTHAQNSTIFDACTPDHIVAIKHLLDTDGNPINGWAVKAMRTIQYDMYGRIDHTEAIMSKKILKQLNKTINQASTLDDAILSKKFTSIAKHIAKLAHKPIKKKSAMLPIALDIRFEGAHDDVQIIFELYQCQQDEWRQLDRWEPELLAMGDTITENYTYTLNGQLPGETPKTFRKRLIEDIAWILAGMLYQQQDVDNTANTDKIPPDTLTGMAPITEETLRHTTEDTSPYLDI